MLKTIENDYLCVTLSSHGAALVSMTEKKTGIDIVLGPSDVAKYAAHVENPYFGATVGRCANRIGNARFTLNDKVYQLPVNSAGVNCIHGGPIGLTFRDYEVIAESGDSVTFLVKSEDGEEGFPGNLKMKVSYTLDGNALVYSFKGICDQDSLFNITNHSYFNMNGTGDVLDHELTVYTDRVALNDSNGMASSTILNVEGSSFDFQKGALLRTNYAKAHENMCLGLDHHFVFENMDFKLMASLKGETLKLNVYSDLPGVQVYTANTVKDLPGKNGVFYQNYCGCALECQYYPNAINYEGLLKPVIKADEEVAHSIRFEVEVL